MLVMSVGFLGVAVGAEVLDLDVLDLELVSNLRGRIDWVLFSVFPVRTEMPFYSSILVPATIRSDSFRSSLSLSMNRWVEFVFALLLTISIFLRVPFLRTSVSFNLMLS
jgi:hypothetical protein